MSRRTLGLAVVLLASCAPPAPRDRSEGDGFTARPHVTAVAPSASASATEPDVEEPAPSASVIAIVGPSATASASAAPSAASSATAGPATVTPFPAEKLKLLGLLTGGAPKALCSTPDGLGVVLKIGDLLPRAAGGTYRVDQITDVDLQLVQVDAPPSGKSPERLTLKLR